MGRGFGACGRIPAVLSRLPLLVLAAALALFAYMVREFWPQTLDDAFITYRYSANLAAGYGPVWNPGEAPAEGYTTFLWMLLLSLPHGLGFDPVPASKILGIVSTLICFATTYAFTSRLCFDAEVSTRRLAAAVAVLLQAAFSPTATHSVSGMETQFYTMLLQLFLFFALLAIQRPTSLVLTVLPIAGLLAGLTRPEGLLAVACTLLVVLVQIEASHRFRLVTRYALLLALPWIGYFLWRFGYYGQLFPLTFYVKVGGASGLAGLPFVLAFIREIAFPLGPLVLLGLFMVRGRVLAPLIGATSLLVFFVLPEHVMGLEFRFTAPVFPFIAVLAGCAIVPIVDLAARAAQDGDRGRVVARLAVIFVLCPALVFGMTRRYSDALDGARFYATGFNLAHLPLGKKLATMRGNGAPPVLAINDAGAVPYYSGWKTIDTVGLNNAHIALGGERDPAYVLSQAPDLIVVPSVRTDQLRTPHPWQTELYEACIRDGMVEVGRIGSPYYQLRLLGRPGSAVSRELAVWTRRIRARALMR